MKKFIKIGVIILILVLLVYIAYLAQKKNKQAEHNTNVKNITSEDYYTTDIDCFSFTSKINIAEIKENKSDYKLENGIGNQKYLGVKEYCIDGDSTQTLKAITGNIAYLTNEDADELERFSRFLQVYGDIKLDVQEDVESQGSKLNCKHLSGNASNSESLVYDFYICDTGEFALILKPVSMENFTLEGVNRDFNWGYESEKGTQVDYISFITEALTKRIDYSVVYFNNVGNLKEFKEGSLLYDTSKLAVTYNGAYRLGNTLALKYTIVDEEEFNVQPNLFNVKDSSGNYLPIVNNPLTSLNTYTNKVLSHIGTYEGYMLYDISDVTGEVTLEFNRVNQEKLVNRKFDVSTAVIDVDDLVVIKE